MNVAVVGAGVSGLTCAVLFKERGDRVSIFAAETGQETTSAAAGAIWFPYDCEPRDKVIAWALRTRNVLVDLAREPNTGVALIELRQFCRAGPIDLPEWARSLGAIGSEQEFQIQVPRTDTTIYLDYLGRRFGGIIKRVHLERLEDVDLAFDLVINCAGFGARRLTNDVDLEPHRGQVAIVPKIDRVTGALVCDDDPLMYVIPRANDCLFGGTNELSEDRDVDPATGRRIVAECCGALKIDPPPVMAERVGIRPFRKSGVRLQRGELSDGRAVIHNYGHGGSGFTLSWGCAEEVVDLARA